MWGFLRNEELLSGSLPSGDLSETEIFALAATFDGYGWWGRQPLLMRITNGAADAWRECAEIPSSLTMLRTCLFGESRRMRFTDYDEDIQWVGGTPEQALASWELEAHEKASGEPSARTQQISYMRALAHAIRDRVATCEVDDEVNVIAVELCRPTKPIAFAIYSDPAVTRKRRQLIGGLMGLPTTSAQRPIENQFSEVLAWLIDHSDAFARGFLALCVHPEDQDWVDAVIAASVIGARTRITLPHVHGEGSIYPDISIEGSDRSFQLLVEAKIDAAFHEYVIDGEIVQQPDAYAHAWRMAGDQSPARVRRVTTLTREAAPLDSRDAWRTASVTWMDVRDLLKSLLAANALPPDTTLIAQEYASAIDEEILSPGPEPEALASVMCVGAPLLDALAQELGTLLPQITGLGRATAHDDYIGRYVSFNSDGFGPLALWLFVTPGGGRYNRPGGASAVGIEVRLNSQSPLPTDLEDRAWKGGFEPVRDLAGYASHRMYRELASNLDETTASAVGVGIATDVAVGLRAGGLVQP